MSSNEKGEKSIVAAIMDWFGGTDEQAKGVAAKRLVKKLPRVPPVWEMIYEKTMSPEFEAKEKVIDKEPFDKWGVPPMHWLVRRYPNPRERSARSYAILYEYFIKAAKRNDLSPEFLHAVFMGEGMMQYIDGRQAEGVGADQRDYNIVDSFKKAGLDNLGREKSKLVGYLDDEHFDRIQPQEKMMLNERKKLVLPAYIYGVDTAVFVTSAYLGMCRKDAIAFLKSRKEKAALADEDKVDFVTYAFFNAPDIAKSDIEQLGMRRYTRKYDLGGSMEELRKKADETQTNVRFNCLIRMAACERIKLLGVYR